MKKAAAFLLVLVLLLPATVMAEACFTYVHLLDEQPILVGEAPLIPFVILTNDPRSAEKAKQTDWLSKSEKSVMACDIEGSMSVLFWSEEKGRFMTVVDTWQEGITGIYSDGGEVNVFYPDSMSGYISFLHPGEQSSTMLTSEKYLLTADQYYDFPAVMVYEAVAEAQWNTDGSDYEVARYLHNWLCDRITYTEKGISPGGDPSFPNGVYCGTGMHGLKSGYGRCITYANAYQILLRAAGIDAFVLEGYAMSGGTKVGHAWNIVRLDGQWCFVDVTWDDTKKTGVYEYDYFAVSKAKMDENHYLNSEDEAFCRFLMEGGLDRAVRNFGK